MKKTTSIVFLIMLLSACSNNEKADATVVSETNAVSSNIHIQENNDNNETPSVANSQDADAQSTTTLGLTPAEFTERFYAVFESVEDDGEWYQIDWRKLETERSLVHQFSDTLLLEGKLGAKGELKSLEYNWASSGNKAEDDNTAEDLFVLIAVTAVVLTPEHDEDEVFNKIADFLKEVSERPEGAQHGKLAIGKNSYIIDITEDKMTYRIEATVN